MTASRGWDVLDWAYGVLPSPSDRSQPLVLTDEQAEFVVAFYEIDQDGVYTYRRAALQGAKGSWKVAIGRRDRARRVLWAGCTVGSVGADRRERRRAGPLNVYALLWALLSENDAKAAGELGIDLGRGRLYLKSNPGAKLEAVSSAWGTREGQRVTFALADETHTWLKSNGGHRLARVLRRNAAKVDGRVLELSNAHELGEESIAEMTETEAGHPGVLFVARRPSVEPSPEMSDEQLLGLLREVYAGAPWVDLPRLLREVRDPGAPFAESLRFYFNVPSAGLLAAVDPITWAARKSTRTLQEGERIGLGFDGSRSRDATALVACNRGRVSRPARDRGTAGERLRRVDDRQARDPACARGRVRPLRRRLPLRRSVALARRARRVGSSLARPRRRVSDQPQREDGAGRRPLPDRHRREPHRARRRRSIHPARPDRAAAERSAATRTAAAGTRSRRQARAG